jgi:hypothetical protein
LENNPLTKEKPNDRLVRVVNVVSKSEGDLADSVAGRNIGISKPEVLAVLEATIRITPSKEVNEKEKAHSAGIFVAVCVSAR